MKHRILAAAALAVAAIGLSATSAHGHGSPAPHDHFLTVPGTVLEDTEVQVGPHVCDLPHLHGAFHKFHSNVHVGQPRDAGGLAIRPEFCVTS